ncbi:heavy metal-associated isoprenylated plant protein 9 [Senna tora]|uniref:Heavy metal-associated isoprenylated plant protein 9 n=1 Tax=Senna tora TaxID=362788 RepID=A0A834WAY3_9FABA|nr:heavy metal-associated isoprenylated plant protein 9 [Senna tora]
MGEEAKQEQPKAEVKPEEEEKKKEEEKPAEEKKKEEEEPKPPSPCVLFVDLHCVGCAKKIHRSILKTRAEGESIPEVVTSQVSAPITVELNVNMHCEACAEQLKRKILFLYGTYK